MLSVFSIAVSNILVFLDAHQLQEQSMSLMKQPQLGLKILELRQQKGFTQEELVEQCNISVRTIQRIEAGEVMPRVYTVKTILAALDRDFDDLQETAFEKKVKKAFLLEIDETKNVSFLFTQLNLGWIAGIISMILLVFQLIEETSYLSTDRYYFGEVFYVVITALGALAFALHMRSFVLIGGLFKAQFLKTSAIIAIAINTLIALYSVFDLHSEYIPLEAFAVIYSVLFGVLFICMGIGLLKTNNLGQLPKATGIINLVLGAMFLTVIMSVVAGPASILAQGLYVAIILRAIQVLKAEIPNNT
ncbi:helix-turn-helix protein [Leeuwenhoekiella aestuarii]|uniref:Helix-turn-helix protein n=1 Tax=Leeuwenhoekiella aestuarii TaxID=2249426 RepID=A0A4Q0NTC5_9FLAO|nr:helix-turn-helix domain-containing protein [Leeuwenhoekiella aestuarii]RXG14329.1 helix-turn-helix protein [Leeuwenhoekiella aestuarii]RXG19078.1 helix-turn-helix protein [Leeuwenhoekiella aestuarii]